MTRRDPTPRPAELLEYLKQHPDGDTNRRICRALDMSLTTFRNSLRKLQMTLGETEDFNVISVRQPGKHGTCVYKIASDMTPEVQAFYDKEAQYIITRSRKLQAVLTPIVRHTDGRTRTGKAVRILHRHISRALEDIAEL